MKILPFWKVRWVAGVFAVQAHLLLDIFKDSELTDDEFIEKYFEPAEQQLKELGIKHNVDWSKFEEDDNAQGRRIRSEVSKRCKLY